MPGIRSLTNSAIAKIGAGEPRSTEEEAILARVVGREIEKGTRLLRVAERADQILAADTKRLLGPSTSGDEQHAPSDPWRDRWVAGAELSSDAHVEEMWARILAGEVRKPGSFSFKTLSVLRDIDTKTAEMFVNLFGFAINSGSVPRWSVFASAYDRAGLHYDWFLRLWESGLLNFAESNLQRPLPSPVFQFSGAGVIWRVSGNDNLVPVHALTQAGKELGKISVWSPRIECCEALGSWLQAIYPQVELSLPGREEFRAWRPNILVADADGTLRFDT